MGWDGMGWAPLFATVVTPSPARIGHRYLGTGDAQHGHRPPAPHRARCRRRPRRRPRRRSQRPSLRRPVLTAPSTARIWHRHPGIGDAQSGQLQPERAPARADWPHQPRRRKPMRCRQHRHHSMPPLSAHIGHRHSAEGTAQTGQRPHAQVQLYSRSRKIALSRRAAPIPSRVPKHAQKFGANHPQAAAREPDRQ